MQLSSGDFRSQEAIPRRCTGDGEDRSPALTWSEVPAGTRELALICDDPDAPRPEPFVHWVLYGIPPETRGLPSGQEPAGAQQGKNSFGTAGYRGPAPPRGHGIHHYHFQLFALDQPVALGPGAGKAELLKAMEGHVLGRAELIGTYQR